MKYILKHTFKNILSKPGRSLILIFCITLTALTAMMAIDLSKSIEGVLTSFVTDTVGTTDITVSFYSKPNLEGIEDANLLGAAQMPNPVYETDDELYCYSIMDVRTVLNFSDFSYAASQGVLNKEISLSGGEAAINGLCAENRNLKIGDKITVAAPYTGEERELTVTDIVEVALPMLPQNRETILVGDNDFRFVNSSSEIYYDFYLIDVHDDDNIKDYKKLIETNNPDCEIFDTEVLLSAADIEGVKGFLILIFALTLLLVFFITISFSERIVTERMSTVGTLRSLGVSASKTAFFLLLENILYALIGSVLGCTFYVLIKNAALPGILMLENSGTLYDVKSHIPATPFYMYLVAILVALAIECIYPIKELIKASQTSIRDIIFDNKDTAFKYTWKRLYAGLILLGVSVVSMFLVKSFVALSISLVAAILAAAILIPYLLKVLSIPLSTLFGKLKMPIAKLAASEVYNNKTQVGTAVLCVTTLILSSCLFVYSQFFADGIATPPYDCDVIVANAFKSEFFFSFIEDMDGVTDVEFEINNYANCKINETELPSLKVCDYEQKDMVVSYRNFEGTLSDSEIVITTSLARRLNLSIGDTVDITFGSDWFIPKSKSLTIKDIIPSDGILVSGSTVFINKELMYTIFPDEVSTVLIRSDNPDDTLAKLLKYVPQDEITMIASLDEWLSVAYKGGSIVAIMYALIALSLGVTIIGAAGNQTIGFINRRRELAVLYSTAMPRKKLNRLLLLENALTVGISSLTAMILGPVLINLLARIIAMLTDGDLELTHFNYLSAIVFITVFFIIMGFTVIKPIRFLKKMNIAEQLKYE